MPSNRFPDLFIDNCTLVTDLNMTWHRRNQAFTRRPIIQVLLRPIDTEQNRRLYLREHAQSKVQVLHRRNAREEADAERGIFRARVPRRAHDSPWWCNEVPCDGEL